jgi:hypothetical protein
MLFETFFKFKHENLTVLFIRPFYFKESAIQIIFSLLDRNGHLNQLRSSGEHES